ncbi:hypothetical protein RHGRI_019857 [Rhododendron griersonianum]|uniref:LRAT domain-containing protein n=1 Tax=Rhododendron griersonianum TaxID=479676 RepID=A0AAV6JHB9_9ERIC|nr:hypothetical protein RHGRI_019857 [Rhododendron griersonianum]
MSGIYIGDGLVIHFTAPSGKFTASSPSSSLSFSSSAPGLGPQRTCPNHSRCEGKKPEGGVAVTCLDCFIKEGSLYRYEYGVRFRLRGGTSTAAQSDPASTVLRRANYLLENGFGNYHLVRNNCEDFALYCKTGIFKIDDEGVQGRSGQIAHLLSMFGPMPAFEAAAGIFFIKVPVKDMDKFHRHFDGVISAVEQPSKPHFYVPLLGPYMRHQELMRNRELRNRFIPFEFVTTC